MDEFAQRLAELCNNHYSKLPSKGKPGPSNWTNLSAVVKETNKDLTVVSMATGTKCIGENAKNCWTVSDSHAEVLCLRLFRLFLAEEIKSALHNTNTSCLVRDGQSYFKVATGTIFHFYTSCIMCGDATISKEADSNGSCSTSEAMSLYRNSRTCKRSPEPSNHAHKVQKCVNMNDNLIRTGAKSIVSDDLFSEDLQSRSWGQLSLLRTKPGRGPLSLSLSCSDKLMKRQYLGLQGGLLSVFILTPIRFATFVIGGNFAIDSVKRALFDRLPSCDSIVEADIAKVADTFVHSLTNTQSRCSQTPSPSDASILWVKQGMSSKHCVGVKGKTQGATKRSLPHKVMLPVCRREMFAAAQLIHAKICRDEHDNKSSTNLIESDKEFMVAYKHFQSESNYRTAKEAMCKHFQGWDRKSLHVGNCNATQ